MSDGQKPIVPSQFPAFMPGRMTRKAIREASREAADVGGGTVYLPAGDYVPEAITVGELREQLAELPADLPVAALFDGECAGGLVAEARREPFTALHESRDSLVLIVE
jgi:hypothetical protein